MNGVLLSLSGRYAVGPHAHALVDEDLFDELSRYKWKAKPNARRTHVYAVRNVVVDGVNKTIRLHRYVLGYFGPLDVDHIDRNTMNNKRSNLRVATRSENVRNASRPTRLQRVRSRPKKALRAPLVCTCAHCGAVFEGQRITRQFCSRSCKKKAAYRRRVGSSLASVVRAETILKPDCCEHSAKGAMAW